MILVSACLLGHSVRYDGGSNAHELLLQYNECERFVAVCPECLAMMPVPRPPMELAHVSGKKVLAGKGQAFDAEGRETTEYLLMGADKLLKIAQDYAAAVAILKEGSPSCGVRRIHDGSFTGKKVRGQGVATALLLKHGLRVYCERDMTAELLEKLVMEDMDTHRF